MGKITKLDCVKLLLADQEMKEFQNAVYQRAIEKTIADGKLAPNSNNYLPPDVLSIAKHHYQDLLLSMNMHKFAGADAQVLDYFISGFPGIIRQRQMTKAMTDFMVLFTTFCMHIGIWFTHVYRPDLHITVYVETRRKDYEGEVTKLLISSMMLVNNNCSDWLSAFQPPIIRDLFGIRIVLEQTDDPKILLEVMKVYVKILSNTPSYERDSFYTWVETSKQLYGGSPLPKELLLQFKDYDFQISHEKNYVSYPKDNGYESWQATYTLGPTSPTARGCMFEIQGRTNAMNLKAEYGINLTDEEREKGLAHDDYKKLRDQLKSEYFNLPTYTGGILFFDPRHNYDTDGVRFTKRLGARTSSVHLVSTK